MRKIIPARPAQANHSETRAGENRAGDKDGVVAERLRQQADAERGEHQSNWPG